MFFVSILFALCILMSKENECPEQKIPQCMELFNETFMSITSSSNKICLVAGNFVHKCQPVFDNCPSFSHVVSFLYILEDECAKEDDKFRAFVFQESDECPLDILNQCGMDLQNVITLFGNATVYNYNEICQSLTNYSQTCKSFYSQCPALNKLIIILSQLEYKCSDDGYYFKVMEKNKKCLDSLYKAKCPPPPGALKDREEFCNVLFAHRNCLANFIKSPTGCNSPELFTVMSIVDNFEFEAIGCYERINVTSSTDQPEIKTLPEIHTINPSPPEIDTINPSPPEIDTINPSPPENSVHFWKTNQNLNLFYIVLIILY